MSKQEKLTKLLYKVRKFCQDRNGKCLDGLGVIDAYAEFCKEMDYPPQPPEMPECVRNLLVTADKVARSSEVPTATMADIFRAINSVEDHYAKPLNLEVGKVYEDASGVNVMVAWIDPAGRFETIGVDLMTGAARYFKQDGTNGSRKSANLIREVAQ